MDILERYDFITKTAVKPARSWSNRDVARFHAFNPNGLCAQKRAIDEEVSRLVEEGRANSGSLIAHGSMADFEHNKLMELGTKRRVERVDLQVAVEMMEEKMERVAAFIERKES